MTNKTDNQSVVQMTFAWLSGQPFNNVLLVGIFAALAWGGHYAITQAIPAHLLQIQQGYREVVEDCHKRHQAEREQTVKTYDRWIDLIQRQQNGNGHSSGATGTAVASPDSQ